MVKWLRRRWFEWRQWRREQEWLENELHDFMHRNDLTRYGDKLCMTRGCYEEYRCGW